MEFIPIEKDVKKTPNKKPSVETAQNIQLEYDKSVEIVVRKTKLKPKAKPKVFEKKNVRNKYRETLELKQKKKVPKKKNQRGKVKKENENETNEEKINVHDSKNELDEELEEKEEQEEEKSDNEAAFQRKCKEMDEKKKNRLFVKLKKKIYSEAQIKELHPDIKNIILPRKKNSRWCWAVFASQEKANAAIKELMENKEILVSRPNPYEKVCKKQKEKFKTVLRKKEVKKKLQKMWT